MPILDFAEMTTTDHYLENEQFRPVRHDALDAQLSFVRSPVDALAPGALPAPARARVPGVLEWSYSSPL